MTRLTRPLTLALTAAVLTSCSQPQLPAATPPTEPGSATSAPSNAATRTATPSPTSRASSTSASRRIDVTVTGKQVQPRPATVNIAVGESLTIAVTSDHNDTLHAHAFNIERAVKAGQRLEITVTGGQQGVYEVELHDPELRLFQVAVR